MTSRQTIAIQLKDPINELYNRYSMRIDLDYNTDPLKQLEELHSKHIVTTILPLIDEACAHRLSIGYIKFQLASLMENIPW